MQELVEANSKINMKQKIIAISAGGTGGHIFPALALAKNLINEGYFVYFFTDKKFFNYVNKNDILLNCEMFKVKILSLKNASRIKQIIMIIIDLWKSRTIITKDISLCIGFGGIVSFPPMLLSILFFKKTIIHEQNAVMGLANRILLPFVDKCLLSFENTKKISSFFKKKCIYTGCPIRDNVKKLVYNYDNPSVNYRAFYKIDDLINLTITGGSQACKIFDEIIPDAIELLPNSILNKMFIHHQCKEKNCDYLENKYTRVGVSHEVKPFFDNLPELLRGSHLVISRAGSSTINEISALGIPSILIPLPTSANNHQYENAKVLRDNNGAILLEQNTITKETISMLLVDLFENDRLLSDLSFGCRKIAKINADVEIVNIINKMILKKETKQIKISNKTRIKYINDNVGLG